MARPRAIAAPGTTATKITRCLIPQSNTRTSPGGDCRPPRPARQLWRRHSLWNRLRRLPRQRRAQGLAARPQGGDGGGLDAAVAAHRLGPGQQFAGRGGRRAGQRQGHVVLVVADQLPLGAAFRAAAEDVPGRAAQAAQPRQPGQGAQQPGAEAALARPAGGRIGASDERRRQLHAELEVALEQGVDAGAEGRVGVETRHLVLVLDRQQLVVVARHALRQQWRRAAHAGDEAAVAHRVGFVLVGGEVGGAAFDQFVEGLRRRDRRRRPGVAFDAGLIVGGQAAPAEGLQVHGDGRAVELDGPLQRRARDRHQALLPGVAEQQQVGADDVAEQAPGQRRGIDEVGGAAGRGVDRLLHLLQRKLPVGIAGEFGGRRLGAVDGGAAAPGRHLDQGVAAGGDDHVAADQRVGLAGGDAYGMKAARLVGDAHVREDGAALLRQAGHVEHRDALAVDVGGHADQRPEGDDAAAADAVDQDVVGLGGAGQGRLGWLGEAGAGGVQPLAAAQPAALDQDEGGTEAVGAGVVLVAGRLVDGALAAVFGLDRNDGQAVRLHAAVAAAFADALVDEKAARRIGVSAALAPAALLGGAGLVVDQRRDAGLPAQFALDQVEFVAMTYGYAGRQVADLVGALGAVVDHDDPPDALGRQLPGQLRHAQRAVERLAAGHGDGIVVEDLVGHPRPYVISIRARRAAVARRRNRAIHIRAQRAPVTPSPGEGAGGWAHTLPGGKRLRFPSLGEGAGGRAVECSHGGADGEQSGVEVGAVAEVDEDVAALGERRLAEPGDALAAHVRDGSGVAVHPDGHVVAADAGHRLAALGDAGRAVVWAAGAEIGDAADRHDGAGRGLLAGLDQRQPLADPRRGEIAADAVGDDAGDARRRQLRSRRQQPVAVRQRPFALLVELADDPRPHVLAPVVEFLLQLVLDELALLLDDQDFLQARGEVAHAVGFERPDHAGLVEAGADLRRQVVVDAEIVEGLAHVEIALAAGDDA